MAKEAKAQGDPAGQQAGSARRRGWCARIARMLMWGCGLLVMVYGLSNLWLWSSWGTGVAEGQLEKRTGQEWQVESMSWSPWNGLSLYGVEMTQPEELRDAMNDPLLRVERIRVVPYWGQLVRGRMRAKVLELDRPEGVVSVEMLWAMASNMAGSLPDEQSTVSLPPKVAKKKVVPDKPKHEGGKPKRNKQGKRGDKKPAVAKETKPSDPGAGKPAEVSSYPTHFSVTGGSVGLVSVEQGIELCALSGVDFSIDLFGEKSTGELHVDALTLPGIDPVRNCSQEFVWEFPFLAMSHSSVDVAGLEARVAGRVGMVQNRAGRLPFRLALVIDKQKLESLPLTDRVAMSVKADGVQAQLQIAGLLTQPLSWRAEGLLQAEDLSVREQHGGHGVEFDDVAVPVLFRRGVIQWSGMRCVGDGFSILGNGGISLRDGHLWVTRVITTPEGAKVLNRGIEGINVAHTRRKWWTILDTPELLMRDLLVTGPLLEPMVDAGDQHKEVSLVPLIQSVLKFIRQEMREEGRMLQSFPGEGEL